MIVHTPGGGEATDTGNPAQALTELAASAGRHVIATVGAETWIVSPAGAVLSAPVDGTWTRR